jgi:hypothetical protein
VLEFVARGSGDGSLRVALTRGGRGRIKTGYRGREEGVEVLGYGVVYAAAGDAEEVWTWVIS